MTRYANLDPASATADTVEGRPYALDDFRAIDPLVAVRDLLEQRHYAGDLGLPVLIYIILSSRVLLKPMNAAVVAPSNTGKSHAVNEARALMPDTAIREIRASSPKALLYISDDLRHRVLIFTEADSLPDDGAAASAIRSLMDCGEMRYETVVEQFDPSTKSKSNVLQMISIPGPTGLITTSTKPLPVQLGTRCLELSIDGSPERTKAINLAAARARRVRAGLETAPDISAFHGMQEWLQHHAGQWKVAIPFDETVAQLLPPVSKLHRDLPQIYAAIETVALLRAFNSAVDGLPNPEHTITATLSDYATVRELIEPYLLVDIADGLTPAGFNVVETIGTHPGCSVSALAKRLSLSVSTVSEHVKRAIEAHWIYNNETYRGKPARLFRTERRQGGHRQVLPTEKEVADRWATESGTGR